MNEEKKTWETKRIGEWTLKKFATTDENGEKHNVISVSNDDASWMLNVNDTLLVYHLLDLSEEKDDDPVVYVLANAFYTSVMLDAELQRKIVEVLAEYADKHIAD